jgi:hypothetical protein
MGESFEGYSDPCDLLPPLLLNTNATCCPQYPTKLPCLGLSAMPLRRVDGGFFPNSHCVICADISHKVHLRVKNVRTVHVINTFTGNYTHRNDDVALSQVIPPITKVSFSLNTGFDQKPATIFRILLCLNSFAYSVDSFHNVLI